MTFADELQDTGRISAFLERGGRGAINADADGAKALAAKGWEAKGGVLFAPASNGELVPMYPLASIFGGEDVKSAVGFQRLTLVSLQPAYKAAFTKYLRLAQNGRWNAVQLLEAHEQKALTEGQDDQGGYVVPADVSAEIFARTAQRAVVRPRATVIPTARDTLRIPRALPHATSGSLYGSAFVGGWGAEVPAFSDTDPVFGLFDISVKKLRVVTKLSNDFVSDAGADVLAFLAQGGGDNFAVLEDAAFIAGDGSALKPRGILNSGVTTVDVEGSTANLVLNTNAATGSAPKIKDLAYALPSQYAAGASWACRRAIEGKVRKLVDFQNRFQFPGPDLEGKPIANTDALPDDGVDGNKVLLFGDFTGYVIANRAQISVKVLNERFSDTDQVGFVLIERVGGACFNEDAFRIGVV